MTKNVALYLRVSTSEQSVDAQERALRNYAAQRGWRIVKVYKDVGESGAKESRAALSALKRDCEAHRFEVIAVWKFDRLARSLAQLLSFLQFCRSHNVAFTSCTEQIDTT